MNDSKGRIEGAVYQAARIYLVIFYTLLTAWTVVSVPLIVSKASVLGTSLLLMIGFIIAITWYWSLGIFHTIKLEDDGSIYLTSFRRTIQTHSEKINQVQGPPIPICFGFMRFRLEREKVYLFFDKNRSFQQILTAIRTSNPNTRFKNLSPEMYQMTRL